MCAGTAEGLRNQYSAQYRKRPSGGDDHPSRVGGVGLAEGDACIDAVAEQHQHQRAHELAQPDRMHVDFLALASLREVECANREH